jgi:hypothetical protein
MRHAIMILALAVLTGCSQTSGSGDSGEIETSSRNYIHETYADQNQAEGDQKYTQPTNDIANNHTIKIKLVQGSLCGRWKHNIVYSVTY